MKKNPALRSVIPGCRVIIKAVEDLPEERGTLMSVHPKSGTCIVKVDPKYFIDQDDDGVREVEIQDLLQQ